MQHLIQKMWKAEDQKVSLSCFEKILLCFTSVSVRILFHKAGWIRERLCQ